MHYIYILRNKVNGKVYYGQTANVKRRMRDHKYIGKYKRKNTPLYNAIYKYGFDQFDITVIAEFESPDEANSSEKEWIKFSKSQNREFGYNLSEGGKSNAKIVRTDKQNKNMSFIKKEYFKS